MTSARKPDWESKDGAVRLYNADCREIVPTLPPANACICDPPYNMKHVDGGGFAAATKFYRDGALNGLTDFVLSEYADTLAAASDQLVAFHSRDQVREYCHFAYERFGNYDQHVWFKTNAIPFTSNTWKSDIEYIALAWRRKHHEPAPQHMKSKAWVSPLCTDTFHPAAKPVLLIQKYVGVIVPAGGTVIDPFMGGGTAAVACLRTGRQFVGIEIDPMHFETAVKRIEAELNRAPLFAEPPATQAELFTEGV